MKDFKLVNAKTVKEAVDVLAELGDKAKLIAGGTDVMLMIRDGKWNNLTLVNIRDIEECRGIKLDGDTVTIGADGDPATGPVSVRYAWDDYPDCDLVSEAGLPVGPFELPVGPAR